MYFSSVNRVHRQRPTFLLSGQRLAGFCLAALVAFGYPLACVLHCYVPPALFAAPVAAEAEAFLCHLPQSASTDQLPGPTRPDMLLRTALLLVIIILQRPAVPTVPVAAEHDRDDPAVPPPRLQPVASQP